MKESEAKALIATLCAGYPHQKVSRPSFALYVEEISAYEADVGYRAVRTLIRYEKWFPSIAQMLEECRNQREEIRGERTERAWDAMAASAPVFTRDEYLRLKGGEREEPDSEQP